MVNTAVISRYLSQDAVAVTGGCSGFVSVINSMFAAVVIVGQNAGRGNYRMIHDYVCRLYRRSLPVCL
ncbi:MAG: hypothetical protein Q4B72_15105, partial [Lachnospiraceae bacterium]|nr:hypothetical protein [Lachnospiraceae bacterium]